VDSASRRLVLSAPRMAVPLYPSRQPWPDLGSTALSSGPFEGDKPHWTRRIIGHNPADNLRLPKRRRTYSDAQVITREAFAANLLPEVLERYRALVPHPRLRVGSTWYECSAARLSIGDSGQDSRGLRRPDRVVGRRHK
jgi:hypothetical protein